MEFLKSRVQELEETLGKYVTTCSSLVTTVYNMVYEREKSRVCDNYEVHKSGSQANFMLSCKCCRRRVENAHCQLNYPAFKEDLKTLFDLGNRNRTVQGFQNEVTSIK